MRKTLTAVLVLVLVAPGFLIAQGYKGKGKVKGVVLDESGNPLEGVRIKLYCKRGASGFETTTDREGEWRAFYIRGGPWDLEFEKPGFIPKKLSVHISEAGRNPDIEVRLRKAEGLMVTEELKEGLLKGNHLFDEGKYQEALEAYQALIEKFPEAYILYKNIGNCYFQMEDYARAEESYKKILEKDPDDHEAKLYIGNTYANRGENAKALEWYNQIDFEDISDPLVLYNIGSRFYQQSAYQEALRYFQRAVEIKEDFVDGLYQLGLVNLTLGNNERAIEVFTRYLEHDTESERADQVRKFIAFLKKKQFGKLVNLDHS